ncbi:MAG: hypothetical protein L0K07_07230, partial [Yaniella sp.]|nr:hypothetical protein [Yaniella sp.]
MYETYQSLKSEDWKFMTVADNGDQKVLDAQVWVNQTYGDVSGYEPAPENGRTGWPVMRSLGSFTRGFAHVLSERA